MKAIIKTLAAFLVLIVLFLFYGYKESKEEKYEFNGR
jgi:hypothetical protein